MLGTYEVKVMGMMVAGGAYFADVVQWCLDRRTELAHEVWGGGRLICTIYDGQVTYAPTR